MQKGAELLSKYARHAERPDTTIWGPHRCFDGLFLALLASGNGEAGNRLLRETLDMIDGNITDELSGRGDKWHLGDFAIHAVWRGGNAFADTIDKDLMRRIDRTVVAYPFHFGGMSENHNLLQHAMRYLAGHEFPDTPFRDGRIGADHHKEARNSILEWAQTYLDCGSEEWGADIYENVNLLSLLNLFDFAPDSDIRSAAKGVLDLMAREMALTAHAGATSRTARRGYACYRISARLSPSRPLHWLWFDSGKQDFDVPWFIGGVLVAALSEYRPPEETVRLAQDPGPLMSSDWNTRKFYQPDVDITETFRVTTRLPGVQLSGTTIPASPSRYTDFTWVASFDEDAVVMANHPHFQPPGHSGADASSTNLLDKYASDAFAESGQPHPLWVPGNMPPGVPGDLRPGFWQGHGSAPACWMQGNILLMDRRVNLLRTVLRSRGIDDARLAIFDISPDEPVQWFHLFLPVTHFDEVVQQGNWLFARRGHGMIRIWSSTPLEKISSGIWKDVEWRCMAPRGALFVEIGSTASDNMDWDVWQESTVSGDPLFDPHRPTVSINHDNQRVTLDTGARFKDKLLPPRARSRIL